MSTCTLQVLRTQFSFTHMDLLPFELVQDTPSHLRKGTDTPEGHSSLMYLLVPGSPVRMS